MEELTWRARNTQKVLKCVSNQGNATWKHTRSMICPPHKQNESQGPEHWQRGEKEWHRIAGWGLRHHFADPAAACPAAEHQLPEAHGFPSRSESQRKSCLSAWGDLRVVHESPWLGAGQMPGRGGQASKLDIHEMKCCMTLEWEDVTWSGRGEKRVCSHFSQAGDKACTLERRATWEWFSRCLWKWGQFLYWLWGREGEEREMTREHTGDPACSHGLSHSCVHVYTNVSRTLLLKVWHISQ